MRATGDRKTIAKSESGVRIVGIAVAREMTGLAESTIRRLVACGDFPRPVQMTLIRKGFVQSEIQEWLEQRVALRDDPAAAAAHPVLNGSVGV